MPPVPELSAKLIFPTKEIVEEYYLPIIYTACRTCYSEQLPDQIWDKAVSRQVADEKQQNLVRKVMESGHGSTIEHVNFTFAISGVTRTLSHQLVRHRAGTAFDQQSQRYVSFKARDNYTVPDSIANGDLPDDLAGQFRQAIDDNLALYGQLLQAEVPAEDARFIFPNAMQTNLIMTVNLRQLIHMSGLRLCTMAQWEIRQMFKQIRHEIFRVSPFFGVLPGAEVHPARLLRRDGQSRRALPHPAASRHGDGRLGGLSGRRADGDRWTGGARDLPVPPSPAPDSGARSPPTTSCPSIRWPWPVSQPETPTASRPATASHAQNGGPASTSPLEGRADEVLDVIPARAGADRLCFTPSAVGCPGSGLLRFDDVLHLVSGAGYEGEPRLVAFGDGRVVDELALVERHLSVGETVEQPDWDLGTIDVACRIGSLCLVRALLDADKGTGIEWAFAGALARALNQAGPRAEVGESAG